MKRTPVSERQSRRTSQPSQLSTRSRTSISPSSLSANPFLTLLVRATSTITSSSSSSTPPLPSPPSDNIPHLAPSLILPTSSLLLPISLPSALGSAESLLQLDRVVLVPPSSPLSSRSLRGLPPTSPIPQVQIEEGLGESAACLGVFAALLFPLPLHRRHQRLQHPTPPHSLPLFFRLSQHVKSAHDHLHSQLSPFPSFFQHPTHETLTQTPNHPLTPQHPLPPLLSQPSELPTTLFSVHKQPSLALLFHLHRRLQPPHPTLLHSHLLRGLSPPPFPLSAGVFHTPQSALLFLHPLVPLSLVPLFPSVRACS
ncbi:hypothetical protein BLNAU_2961 [Blattamonas nauphoetae]|uniref:Uncharacterized protein n=1 Tax=Blattamonas nauphoetae TaxID=2049346 RepID=A0ABQ9YDW4_9EUKA|nr:hypothetical protein BLNAU_2961 [Blattamonas nauphoetae]